MNVFTEISTRELENTLKGKAVRYIVNDARGRAVLVL